MGRELQKKKNKSGIARVRHKPKSKKNPVLANALIAANWDKKQTLSQNYRRLGLATRLNGQTGGTEAKTGSSGILPAVSASLDVKTSRRPTQFEAQEVRIERDPATGAILRVLDDENSDGDIQQSANPNLVPLDDPLNSMDSIERPALTQHHNSGHVGQGRSFAIEPASEFLKKLEADAARPGGKKPRKQSQREQEWCQKLFEKYGQDWSAMARDAKLNVMQQSEGNVKKRITKWLKEAGPKEVGVADG